MNKNLKLKIERKNYKLTKNNSEQLYFHCLDTALLLMSKKFKTQAYIYIYTHYSNKRRRLTDFGSFSGLDIFLFISEPLLPSLSASLDDSSLSFD